MMETKSSRRQEVEQRTAYVLLRATVGINFLGHGAIRLWHGNALFAQGMVKQLANAPLPAGFVYGFGWVLPIIEFAIGLLLVLGVGTRWALTAGMLVMMALMVGVTLNQDWATAGSQLLYSFLLALLLFLRATYDASWLGLLPSRTE